MANLSNHTQLPTVQAIYRHYEQSRSDKNRPHLGGSQVGHSCDRFLWYQFHWAGKSENIDGRVLRLFDHGDCEETRLVRDLRNIGVTVYDVDPSTGRQFLFTAFGGHFGISLDGVGVGFQESDKWHLLEFKTANKSKFQQLKKDGLQKWNPQYWAQVIIGMHLADLPRTMHLTTCKDNDEIYGERVKPDDKQARRLLDRAERIIFSDEPLERVSDRPDWFECKFCPMHSMCHGDEVAAVNCRTCAHSTAKRDGTWHCERWGQKLSVDHQRKGCSHHLFRPDLVPYAEAVDSGDDWIQYQHDGGAFYNAVESGEYRYISQEITNASQRLPLEPDAEKIRLRFDGTVEG